LRDLYFTFFGSDRLLVISEHTTADSGSVRTIARVCIPVVEAARCNSILKRLAPFPLWTPRQSGYGSQGNAHLSVIFMSAGTENHSPMGRLCAGASLIVSGALPEVRPLEKSG
jgi:hypothetical protein